MPTKICNYAKNAFLGVSLNRPLHLSLYMGRDRITSRKVSESASAPAAMYAWSLSFTITVSKPVIQWKGYARERRL